MRDHTPNQRRANVSPTGSTAEKITLYLKGMAMGLGDSVPGVSGGTIAVITNIYEQLVYSIRAVDTVAVKLVISGQLAAAWRHINGPFLLILALGMLSGLLLSANTVLFLLANYFSALMAFFIGLVLASTWLLKNEFNYRRWQNLCGLLLGILLVLALSFLNPRYGELSYFYVFICGAIAISAMILPGLSGAFILILLGAYEFILAALIEFNLPYILVFSAGCGVGLLAFSRLLAWLLSRQHQLSYAFITGMLLGSMAVLWPWQQAQSFYTDSSGQLHALQTIKLSPFSYSEVTGGDPMLFSALASFLLGIVLLSILHRLSNSTVANVKRSNAQPQNKEADNGVR